VSDTPKKVRLPKHLTPIGVAVFPRLKDPDFKFKKEHGEYSVKLRLPEAEARKIIALADAVAEESYRSEMAKADGKLDKKGKPIEVQKAEPSFEVELDDNKQPKGTILISFKMHGGWTDKKTGEKVKKSCPIFDSVGQDITGKVDVWGGSQLRVSYEISPYFAEADRKAGASFRMLAVQVVKLVTKGSGDASMFGFGKEDGFSAAEMPAEETPAAATTEATNGQAKARGDF
jgi:hypothetical protein